MSGLRDIGFEGTDFLASACRFEEEAQALGP